MPAGARARGEDGPAAPVPVFNLETLGRCLAKFGQPRPKFGHHRRALGDFSADVGQQPRTSANLADIRGVRAARERGTSKLATHCVRQRLRSARLGRLWAEARLRDQLVDDGGSTWLGQASFIVWTTSELAGVDRVITSGVEASTFSVILGQLEVSLADRRSGVDTQNSSEGHNARSGGRRGQDTLAERSLPLRGTVFRSYRGCCGAF